METSVKPQSPSITLQYCVRRLKTVKCYKRICLETPKLSVCEGCVFNCEVAIAVVASALAKECLKRASISTD
jgi:hypothetical protein